MPTAKSALTPASEISRRSGCTKGSPPVRVNCSTRARRSRGITVSRISLALRSALSRVDETKQCAQWRLQRSVIWSNAFLPVPPAAVRKKQDAASLASATRRGTVPGARGAAAGRGCATVRGVRSARGFDISAYLGKSIGRVTSTRAPALYKPRQTTPIARALLRTPRQVDAERALVRRDRLRRSWSALHHGGAKGQ